ncbi:helix-turn-helix transcriptional regulator [Streptomyces sp. B-S-A8]|uniref:Helix-turn-helix transcriptional regulator n=1 Tax=Streptomyces solicavernae TaxID=3043614 RepID=A0ABT6RRY6_9ACTN|nr:helix-turn-helix transcriptional regulator [Streptomyces sp. B-S-A8]MDI3387090.1 helix-turn-helix transcriptional regulator [Streptomyces sp. B-S-A8]
MGTRYGDWVRQRREAAGMTQQELADAAVMTRSHIAHIEAGRRIPSREDARRLDRALGTGDVLQRFRPGDDEHPVADHFESARQLEQQATAIREFGLSYVPGLLQTEAYARAVVSETAYPPLSQEQREKVVATRLRRAEILSDPVTPLLWTMLDEAVIRRPIGGPAVMAEQLGYLADLADSGRIRVHVLPLAAGGHPLLPSMLKLMRFEDQPPAAYTEGLGTGGVQDSPALVEVLQGAYHHALGDALPVKDTVALLRGTAKDYAHHDS